MPEDRRHAAIMFTDIVGYTSLMGSDEDRAFDMLARNHTLHEILIEKHNGILIKEVGDGTLASFPLASNAVRCAIDIQKEAKDQKIPLKIGIHEGEMVFAGGDVLGDGVNIASRLQEFAQEGCIAISGKVYSDVKNKSGINIKFVGDKKLKNVSDPVKVYEVMCSQEIQIPREEMPNINKRHYLYYFIAGLIIILIAVIVWQYIPLKEIIPVINESESVEIDKSIAVLPFVNMSNDPDQEYFSDGMSEEILNKLSQIKDLKVIARTSSFAFKGRDEDMREIGKKLDVAHLLEGSVRKAGNHLRITAQLIRVSDGSHLWSQSYDQEIIDVASIFDIQDEISFSIVDNLKVNLLGNEIVAIEKRHTENLEAYNLALQGDYYLSKMTPEGFEKAAKFYKQLLEKDPNYARGYVGLAYVSFFSTIYGYIPPNEAFPKAKEYVYKALAIDNNLAMAHTALGNINMHYDWNWKSAANELELALQLNPNSIVAHANYSVYLTLTERHDEAIDEAKHWLKLDPLSAYANTMLGQAYLFAQQHDKAMEEVKKTLSMHPNYFLAHQLLGDIYSDKSMIKEAGKAYKQALELSGGYEYAVLGLVWYYNELGQNEKAEELLNNLEQRSHHEYVPPTIFFIYHLHQGDMDKAYEWLKRAIDEKDSFLVWLRIVPQYRRQISNEPRLITLMKKLN